MHAGCGKMILGSDSHTRYGALGTMAVGEGGAIIMSSISASKETTNEENNKMFRDLFLLSVANVAINVILSALGVFSLGGIFC